MSHPPLGQLVPQIAGRGEKLLSMPAGVVVSQVNPPALYGAGLIDALPERTLIAAERIQRIKWGNAPAGKDEHPVGRVARLYPLYWASLAGVLLLHRAGTPVLPVDFEARLPELRTWAQSLVFAHKARGEVTLTDRLRTPILTGLLVGAVFLWLYHRNRRRV